MAKILSARDDIASQVGGEVIRGLRFDGSGNPMFKAEDALSEGYTDKTTLTNWDLYGAQVDGLKYKDFRNILIADFVGDWFTLSSTDKKTLIRHYVYDSTETTVNLDLLYTKVERDDFQNNVIGTLNVNSETMILRSNMNGSTKFFDHQTDDSGIFTTVEITSDTEVGTVSNDIIKFEGHINGARLSYVSATSVSAGTTGEKSSVRNNTNTLVMSWTGLLTADITTAGAGGLQTGQSEAVDTWYQVLTIGDTTGTNNPNILLVPDGVAFSESGYDVFRRVGWFRNDSSSNIMNFYYTGRGHTRRFHFDVENTAVRVLNAGSASTFTSLSLTYIPSGIRIVNLLNFFKTGASGAAADLLAIRPGGSTTTNVLWKQRIGVISGVSSQAQMEVVADSSQQIEYRVSDGVNNAASIHIISFVDEL